jgi:hypothetical protein
MKYIIEFKDEPELLEEGLAYYKCVDAPWFIASDNIIKELLPYTTPYTEGEDYKQGTSDAWEFAGYLNEIGRDIVENVYLSMNGGKGMGVAFEMTYEEAKKKYDEYYQKKREKNFCVGAEVENEDGETAYVLNPDYGGCLVLSMKEYACPQIQRKENWKCTGAINDQIENMLMR